MEKEKINLFNFLGDFDANRYAPNGLILEPTGHCTGGCVYCYSSSTGAASGSTLPSDKVRELLREAREIGIRGIHWCGGDPLLHPEIFELMDYTREIGLFNNGMQMDPGSITKKVARGLVAAEMGELGIHIDTLDQEIHNRMNYDPRALQRRINGYRNLLEAGYPPNQVFGTICLTQETIQTYRETTDWFLDEMGASCVNYVTFRPEGLAREGLEAWELTPADMKRIREYLSQKLALPELLRTGSSDSIHVCKNYFAVKDNGEVIPCVFTRDLVVGNVYQESLQEIFRRHRELLTFSFEIKGQCGECENNDVCFGCRANAYHFLGDIQASDPKCWLNLTTPQSSEPSP
ncbi:MAG: radical SAM protein [Candidatus Tectomicrobia bacterium]|uniref:Radical SAM protein n=1 Tax=Tectimicrobiota bacterium TaxID=2528274 RepID=A0A932CNE0_UNCTE|nr:radical SAM protein [Candidatus Tectomicrobia bacterium]